VIDSCHETVDDSCHKTVDDSCHKTVVDSCHTTAVDSCHKTVVDSCHKTVVESSHKTVVDGSHTSSRLKAPRWGLRLRCWGSWLLACHVVLCCGIGATAATGMTAIASGLATEGDVPGVKADALSCCDEL
jgi:hypothetical protein